MLQKTTQWITDRLVERALPSIGSFMASALQRMRYESAGKPHLAKLIRDEAQQMTLSDPFTSAPTICERLTDDSQNNGVLPLALPDTTTPKKKRSKNETAQNDITDDGGEFAE